jgi:hypothetical protein
MASIPFLDIVSYSAQPMDQQSRSEWRWCSSTIPWPPYNAPIDIARALKHDPALPLRMGVHSGPVYRHADIRDQLNVVAFGTVTPPK